jgi:polar amino acid transport system substrate-binding protein
MVKTLRYLTIVALTMFLMVTMGCDQVKDADDGGKAAASESLLDTIVKRGTLKVGMSTFVPWAMKDKTGKLIGFEIDVATRLAKDMGVKIEFVPTKWAGIIPALLTGKFDVIIGGMGVRPARNLKVNFTVPYDYSGMSMVAHKKRAKGFSSLADFNKKGVIIAARLGTTAAEAVKKNMPKAELKQFDDESQAIQELLTGRIHAVVASAPMPAFKAVEYKETLFLPFSGTFTKEPIGFAVKKGDHDLLNYFNNWIMMVGAEGWLAETRRYWFETKDWESQVQ